MSVERRLLACVLLLACAAQLPLTFLPDLLDAVTLPLAVAATAVVVTLLPSQRTVQAVGWCAGALFVLAFVHAELRPDAIGSIVLLPLGVLLLTGRSAAAAIVAAIGALALAMGLGLEALVERRAFAWTSAADALASTFVWGWAAWLGTAPLDLRGARLRLRQQERTAAALDVAIDRDRRWLTTLAEAVADPSLVGPVRGAGLGPGTLAIATRIDGRRVLLGWLEGDPLAMLSAAWALAADARARRSSARALVRFAHEHLEEMLPADGLRWLAIWDRHSGALDCTLRGSPSSLRRCVITARGPVEVGKPETFDAAAVVGDLLPLRDASSSASAAVPPGIGAPIGAAVLAGSTAAMTCLELPAVALAGVIAALLLAHEIARRGARRRNAALEHMQARLTERAELQDDLRFRIAKLHGGLLPYRLAVGRFEAIAHRLRGEVLDGSFADLVLDPQGVGHVIAGEVAGRGIAARFLGLTAQVLVRAYVENGRTQPEVLCATVVPQLRRLGEALQYPVRLRLGAVAIEPDGWCEGQGMLRRMVTVRGVSTAPRTVPLAAGEIVRVTADARLDDDTRVYLTPAPSLPGPEDDAPALDAVAAADRVRAIVQARKWRPEQASLASLFSLVFDGVAAPSHGTLVELRTQQDGSDREHGETDGEQHEPATIAAI